MPKTCPAPRRTPCDGAWPYEKEDCCYKRLPKASGTKTSRKAPTNNASKAARKIAQSAMKKATQGPTVADLRADAKAKKIKGFSTMTKAQLMKALSKVGEGSSGSSPKSKNPNSTKEIQKMVKWSFAESPERREISSGSKVSLSSDALAFLVTKTLGNLDLLLKDTKTVLQVLKNAEQLGKGRIFANDDRDIGGYLYGGFLGKNSILFEHAIDQSETALQKFEAKKNYPDGMSSELVNGITAKFSNASDSMAVFAIGFLQFFYAKAAESMVQAFNEKRLDEGYIDKLSTFEFKKKDIAKLIEYDPQFLPILG